MRPYRQRRVPIAKGENGLQSRETSQALRLCSGQALHPPARIRLRPTGRLFRTICVRERECVVGDVEDGEMILSDFGQIAAESWQWLAEQYPYVTLGTWVVMPNHLHGIIVINDNDGSRDAS